MTTTEILAKFNVTREQVDACDFFLHNGKVVYSVASASRQDVRYHVSWNEQHGCLQCRPAYEGGPVCGASAAGIPCWHKRAALAHHQEYRELKAAERKAQERIALAQRTPAEIKAEATIEALVRGGCDRETATRVANAKPAPINRRARGYATRPGFSLMA